MSSATAVAGSHICCGVKVFWSATTVCGRVEERRVRNNRKVEWKRVRDNCNVEWKGIRDNCTAEWNRGPYEG